MRPWRVAVAAGVVTLAFGCSDEADPRPQLLVVVDTNVPTVQQAIDDSSLSPDAALDTLRVDVIGADGTVVDFLDVVGPDPADWPVSFGAVTPESGTQVRFRLRLFRGRDALAGELNGVPTLEPIPDLTIDRVVDLEQPRRGVRRVRIVLDGDCLGLPASFGSEPTSCASAALPAARADEGVELVDSIPASVTGTWELAREVPCSGPAPSGTVCIPGGFSLLGDTALVGLGTFRDAAPLRPVYVSPYFLDRSEYTVKQYEEHVAERGEPEEPPFTRVEGDPQLGFCSLLASNSSEDDDLALTCLRWETARELCLARGGDLPSEVQWEHAARGRGEGRVFPWGNEPFECCAASISRAASFDVLLGCPAEPGYEPVGSHLPSADCGGLGDESRDGVWDLAGGVSEVTRDNMRDYDSEDCWRGPGVLRDPLCETDGGLLSKRGGAFTSGTLTGLAALRAEWAKSAFGGSVGFRCVFADGASGE